MDEWLGYDDEYQANELTRHMYQATWNSLAWLPTGHLNLESQCILFELEVSNASKLTTEVILHAY